MSGQDTYRETVLITGANRGIGLALARKFLAEGFRVFACARHPGSSEELRHLRTGPGEIRVFGLDVSQPKSIRGLGGRLAGEVIDILINNAGLYGPEKQELDSLSDDARAWKETFAVNVMGPFLVCRAFVAPVARSRRKIMASIGSGLGSISEANSGAPYIYRASKAAVHMVMRGLQADLVQEGILCVAFHPGWVRTRMGGPEAPMEPEESAAELFRTLTSLKREDGGRLLNFDGKVIPW